MKKILASVLAILMIISMAACGGNSAPAATEALLLPRPPRLRLPLPKLPLMPVRRPLASQCPPSPWSAGTAMVNT